MARPTLTLVIIMLVAAVLEAPFVHRAGPRTIPIGGADLGLARNWGYKEWSESWPGSHGPITSLYRWLGARSELLFTPVAPRQPQLLSLSLIGGRPDQTVVAPVAIHAQKQAVNAFGVAPVLRHYRLLIPLLVEPHAIWPDNTPVAWAWNASWSDVHGLLDQCYPARIARHGPAYSWSPCAK